MTATPHAAPAEGLPVADEPTRPDYAAEVLRIQQKARASGLDPARQAAERQAREDELARRRRAILAERYLTEAVEQVPARYRDAEADHPEVRRWIEDVVTGRTSESLILLGTVGTGKTYQAYGAFAEVVRRRPCRALAVAVPALLDGLRPGRPGHVDYDAVERADLLLLDDLAAERPTDWTGETLYRLIDARWSHMRPTIITTNATPRQVAERLGDRVASRLAGMGRSVVMTGEDRRRGAAR